MTDDGARWIVLDGAYNVRDLGGLPTSDGGTTRRGRMFRSDALHYLEPAGVERFRELHVVTVVDLRSEHEAEAAGRGLLADEPLVFVQVPLGDVGAPGYTPPPALASGNLGEHYITTFEARTPGFARALTHLAEAEHLPAVFHCTAGKDRTGVLAALVLGVVGVGGDDIVADYALTDDRMPMIMARLRGGTGEGDPVPADVPVPGLAPELGRAKASAMSTFLDALDERYGGPLGWAGSQGLDDVVVRLRAELVDPA